MKYACKFHDYDNDIEQSLNDPGARPPGFHVYDADL